MTINSAVDNFFPTRFQLMEERWWSSRACSWRWPHPHPCQCGIERNPSRRCLTSSWWSPGSFRPLRDMAAEATWLTCRMRQGHQLSPRTTRTSAATKTGVRHSIPTLTATSPSWLAEQPSSIVESGIWGIARLVPPHHLSLMTFAQGLLW